MRRHGFTLVELMMVVMIIALLAALAFPAARMVQASALSTKCRNNLRQIGLAFTMYGTENQGRLATIYPRNDHFWHGLIAPYVEALAAGATGTIAHSEVSRSSILWGCPCYDFTASTVGWNTGYARNYYPVYDHDRPSVLLHDNRTAITTASSFRNFSLSQITYPSQRLLAKDGGSYSFNFDGSLAAVRSIWNSNFANGLLRHGTHENGVCFDGSVKAIPSGDALWYASREPEATP